MTGERIPPTSQKDSLVGLIPDYDKAYRDAETALVKLVAAARKNGATWVEIGTALGVTRQAAWERFARRIGKVASG